MPDGISSLSNKRASYCIQHLVSSVFKHRHNESVGLLCHCLHYAAKQFQNRHLPTQVDILFHGQATSHRALQWLCRKKSVFLGRSLLFVLVILYDWPRLVASTSFYRRPLYIRLTTPIFMEHYRNILFTECCRMSWKYSFRRTSLNIMEGVLVSKHALKEASWVKHHQNMLWHVLVPWFFSCLYYNLFFPQLEYTTNVSKGSIS